MMVIIYSSKQASDIIFFATIIRAIAVDHRIKTRNVSYCTIVFCCLVWLLLY
jgi:hypothetical protein